MSKKNSVDTKLNKKKILERLKKEIAEQKK
jgi:hypothetical protein